VRRELSASRNRIVPLARVCELAGVARSSVYARRSAKVVTLRIRRGPKTAYSDARLTEDIRAVLAASPFVGKGYRKVWAKLRYGGIRTSKVRVLRYEALEPLRQGIRRCFGAIRENVAAGLTVRHDHGSQPAFVRAPEGNGCAERVIRTLKEQLLWVRAFATVVELRLALLEWPSSTTASGSSSGMGIARRPRHNARTTPTQKRSPRDEPFYQPPTVHENP